MANQTRVVPENTNIQSSMLEATFNLAENILQSEPFRRYKAADQKLQADQAAQKLLADLSKTRQKIRDMQSGNQISENDLKQLQALQIAVSENDTIQDFQLTQGLAVAFLQDVNQEISMLLGIDFSSLTRRASGCC